jgi:serine/threonine protein phosphatase 1
MGNHERMLLDFLDDPAGRGRRWLGAGGTETLASFGIDRVEGADAAARLEALAAALRAALPEGTEAWLRALPLLWQTGGLAVVHAAADPALPLADQPEAALLWGHRAFRRQNRADGIWVAHGHVVTRDPEAGAGRIAVDTGAWASGRLSAAWIAGGRVDFLQG